MVVFMLCSEQLFMQENQTFHELPFLCSQWQLALTFGCVGVSTRR